MVLNDTPRRRCRECGRLRPASTLLAVSHFGGGNYRVPGRWYASSICRRCAEELLASLQPHEQDRRKVRGWSVIGLRAALGKEEK